MADSVKNTPVHLVSLQETRHVGFLVGLRMYIIKEPHGKFEPFTLYNVLLCIARNFLETRENIKISTYPFYHINLG